MPNWFQTIAPQFSPAQIATAAARGGYQAPRTVWGEAAPRYEYGQAPGPETLPPGGYTDAWWNSLSPQEQAWRQSQRTDQRTPPMTPLSQIVTGMAGGAPRVPSTARVPQVGSPDWYAGQFPGAPQAPRGYNPFQDPARQARMEYWRQVPGGGMVNDDPRSFTGPAGAQGGGMVQLRAPTGQMRSVPAAQAAFYLARGASRM